MKLWGIRKRNGKLRQYYLGRDSWDWPSGRNVCVFVEKSHAIGKLRHGEIVVAVEIKEMKP